MAHRLAVERLTVDFPGTRAVEEVSLGFEAGEVHGVIGENGAGKSTLMRVLAGLQRPTAGRVLLDGEEVVFAGPRDAMAAGVAMIHQELNLVDELSVAENLFLGREPSRLGCLGLLRRRQMYREARQVLGAVGSAAPPGMLLGRLGIAQQQMVEIARALSQSARVLIMDEPTAVLGEREGEVLFQLISRLRDEGRTVIYISHRLGEVLRVCDRISVLRDGRLVRTLGRPEVRGADEQKLASMMVGRPAGQQFPERRAPQDRVVLKVEGLSTEGGSHSSAVEGVTFAVRAGEIFGLAGLIGAGRTECAEGIAGLRRRTGGRIHVEGREVTPRRPGQALRAGIAYLSEDRKATGLLLEQDIASNTTLATLRRYGKLLLHPRAERASAARHAASLRTRYARLTSPVATLSGGNQQKVALAKWLDASPKVLLLDEPTRGVDVGAKAEIYRVIAQLAAGGMACVMISSELPELLGMCHRIGVMHAGRLVASFDAADATEEHLMHAAAGLPAPAAAVASGQIAGP